MSECACASVCVGGKCVGGRVGLEVRGWSEGPGRLASGDGNGGEGGSRLFCASPCVFFDQELAP